MAHVTIDSNDNLKEVFHGSILQILSDVAYHWHKSLNVAILIA